MKKERKGNKNMKTAYKSIVIILVSLLLLLGFISVAMAQPGNTPPVAYNLDISPSLPLTDDDLVCSYSYSDADGDPEEGSEVRWYMNGALQTTYNDIPTIPSSATLAGQEWYFTVRPNDGENFGELKQSDTVVIDNTPPVASFTYSPENPLVNEEITFDASASYPDGEIVSYNWDFGDGNSTDEEVVTHSYTEAGMYTVTLTVTDNDGLTDSTQKEVEIVLNEPPITIHQFSGENKNAIKVKLIATDEQPGVEKTIYTLLKRDGSSESHEQTGFTEEPAITEFTIDLDEVERIIYHSIDGEGMAEESHEISVMNVEDEKAFENVALARDTCFGLGSYYSVYFTINYFKISDEMSNIIFVDGISVSVAPYYSGIGVVGLRLDRNGKTIGTDLGSLWYDIGAVDWEGEENDYIVHAQLRSTSPAGCERYLWEGSLPLVISPGGIIYWKVYCSDRIFSSEIPVEGSFKKTIWDRINPFQSKTHNIEIENVITKASFDLSWPGSDLDMILYDPDSREINPEIAATDPDIDFNESVNYEQYTILNPVPGNWAIEIRAIDVPDEGEGYVVVAHLIQSSEEKIPATVRIEPETLNLASKGMFTAFITLPEGYDVEEIDIVVCEGASALKGMVSKKDSGTYIAKFNRQDLINVPTGDAVTLIVSGKVYYNDDLVDFEGSDTIRVIEKGKK